MDTTRIIAIRHGETAWNVDSRIQGQLDIPLNHTGRWQAGRAAQALAGEPIASLYSSDLQRACETAQAVASMVDLPIRTDVGLRERHFGVFQGHRFADIEVRLPEQALLWRQRDPAFAPDGGECLNDFRDRVMACVNTLAARHPGGLIAIVAHGGVMDVLYRAATGQGLQAPRSWELGNAAINRLLWTPEGLTLVGWADTTHLEQQGALDENTA